MAELLDQQLATAQDAINLPEVQEMVKRLAAYNLGVFMPHIHDSEGNMLPMPEEIVQVEDDLRVSFMPVSELRDTPEKTYLPVGWFWSAENNAPVPKTHCPMVKDRDGNWSHSGTTRTN